MMKCCCLFMSWPHIDQKCVVSPDVQAVCVDGGRLIKMNPEVQENSVPHKNSDQIMKRTYAEELRRDPTPDK